MAEDLEDKLVKIEKKLGSDGEVPPVRDLEWHLDTIESLISGGGPGGTSDHTQLTNRDAADQHPISSITDLQNTLNSKAAQADLAGKQNITPVFPITNFSFASNNIEFSFNINQESLAQLKANTERIIILEENNGSGYKEYYTFTLHSQPGGGKVYICSTTKTANGNGLSTLSFYLADDHTNNTIWGQAYSQFIKDVDIDTFDASTGTLYLRYNVIDANITWFNYPVETITPEQEAAIISLLPSRGIASVKTLELTKASNEYVHINNLANYLVDSSNAGGTTTAFPVKTQIASNDPVLIWTDENYYYVIKSWTATDGDTDLYLFRATFNYATGGGEHLKARVAASDITITPLTENGVTQNIQVTFNSADFVNILAEDLFRIRFAVNDSIMGKDPEWKFADYYINSKLANETILGSTATSMLIANDSWDDVGSTIVVYKSDSNVTITFLQSVWVSIINQIKDLIIDDNFYIEIETIGSSSSGGLGSGSGKLYEFKFNLTRYDENGSALSWSTHIGDDYTKLPLSMLIYESNYERFKQTFATAWAAINPNEPAPNIDTPQQLVNILNTYVNVKTESYDSDENLRAVSLITLSIMNVDKCTFQPPMSMLVESYFALSAGLIIFNGTGGGISTESFTGLIQEDGNQYDSFFGLDIDNSCTLTEYGTSAGGGGSSDGTKVINLNNYATDAQLTEILTPIIAFAQAGTTMSQVINPDPLPINWDTDDTIKLTYTLNDTTGEMIMRKAVSLNGLKGYQCSSTYITQDFKVGLVNMSVATAYGDPSSFIVLTVSVSALPGLPEQG